MFTSPNRQDNWLLTHDTIRMQVQTPHDPTKSPKKLRNRPQDHGSDKSLVEMDFSRINLVRSQKLGLRELRLRKPRLPNQDYEKHDYEN